VGVSFASALNALDSSFLQLQPGATPGPSLIAIPRGMYLPWDGSDLIVYGMASVMGVGLMCVYMRDPDDGPAIGR